MPDAFEAELIVATDAVVRAAAVCDAIQGKVGASVLEKRDRSPVTVADYCSQALICRALTEALPGDPIVAEEDADDLRAPAMASLRERIFAELSASAAAPSDLSAARVLELIALGTAPANPDRFWTLDPVDGTKGFLRGQHYAIALALIVGGEVVLGALACPKLAWGPHTGTVLTAVRGHGAFGAPLHDPSARTPIRVSPQDEARWVRTCESVESGHSNHGASAQMGQHLGIEADPVRLDSQAKYGVVARGDAELYLRLPTRPDYDEKIWDHAAGCVVVQEAGGRVTDALGAPLDFSRGRTLSANRGVVASNDVLHDSVLKALAHVGMR
ncbi:MAG: 3'(2'),5'-bisphosphate nucleotidase [Deltaproteobacteria bacterium]|nr:3'(2'),5'-bisphosphate nucleotidase [Deltaproteobacteria bacterium]